MTCQILNLACTGANDLPASWKANLIAALARSVHWPSEPRNDVVRSEEMVVQIAGQPPEPPLRARSVLGIALLSEDERREVKDEAASGIENASAPRAPTKSREAMLAIILKSLENEGRWSESESVED
jgi:hypothetical protein